MAVVYSLKHMCWSVPQRMHTSGYGTSWMSCTLHVLCLIASCSMVQCSSEADSLVLNSIVEYPPGFLVFPRMRRKRREGRKGRLLICFLVSVIKQWPKTAWGRREFISAFRSHSNNEGSQCKSLESGKDHGRTTGLICCGLPSYFFYIVHIKQPRDNTTTSDLGSLTLFGDEENVSRPSKPTGDKSPINLFSF